MRLRLFAHLIQFFRRAIAPIGIAAGKKQFDDLAMSVGTGELIDRLLIGFELQPGQAIEDRGNCGIGRARPVGVLDAKQKLPPAMARIKPVE